MATSTATINTVEAARQLALTFSFDTRDLIVVHQVTKADEAGYAEAVADGDPRTIEEFCEDIHADFYMGQESDQWVELAS